MKRTLRLDGKTWREQDAEAKQRIYQHHASREIGECLEDNLVLKEEGETNYAVLISTRSYKNYGNGFESWITEIDVEVTEGSFQIVPLQKLEVVFPQENDFTRVYPSDFEFVKELKSRVKEAEATSNLAKQLFLGLIDRAEEAEKRAERAEFDLADLKAENIRLQENINVLIQLNEANNDSQIKDELQVRIDKAINLLQDEMGDWLPIGSLYLPDHYLQLRHILDVLRGDGE